MGVWGVDGKGVDGKKGKDDKAGTGGRDMVTEDPDRELQCSAETVTA